MGDDWAGFESKLCRLNKDIINTPDFYTTKQYGNRVILRKERLKTTSAFFSSIFKLSLPSKFTLFIDGDSVDSCEIEGHDEKILRGKLDNIPIKVIVVWKCLPFILPEPSFTLEVKGTKYDMDWDNELTAKCFEHNH